MVDTIVVNVRALVSGGEGVRGLGGDLNSLRGNILSLNAGLQIMQQVTQGVQQMVGSMKEWADTANKSATDLRVFDMTVAKFGVNIDEANGAAERLATKFGLSVDQVKASMTTLMRVGFTDMGQLEKTMEGAAASAIAFGRSAQDGFERVGDAAATGMSAALNSIGVAENLGPALDKVAKAAGKTADELTDAEKATALYNLITKATATEVEALDAIQNDYVRGQQQVTLAQYELSKSLGELTLPLMARYYEVTGQAISKTNEFVQALRDGQSPLEALAQVFPHLSGPIEAVSPYLEELRNRLSEAGEVSQAVLAPAFRTVQEVLEQTLNQVMPVVDEFGQTVTRNWGIISDGVTNVLGPIFAAILPMVETVWREVPGVVETGARLVNETVALMGTAISGVFQLVELAWDNFFKPVWDLVGPVVEASTLVVIRAVQQVADIVTGIFKAINVAAEGDWTKAWDTFLSVASRSTQGVNDALTRLGEVALEKARYIGGTIKDGILYGAAGLGDLLVQRISADLERLTAALPDWVKDRLGITSLQNGLNNASTYLNNVQNGAVNRVIDRGNNASERRINGIQGNTRDWNQAFIRSLTTTFKNDPQVSSDCAIIASAILRSIGVNIESSVNAGVLEKNAIKAGGHSLGKGAAGQRQATTGDLVVWTSQRGGNQYGAVSGKHVAVVVGQDEKGNLLVIHNPGSGNTAVVPMFDTRQAEFYRFAENPINNVGQQNQEVTDEARRGNAAQRRTPAPPKPAPKPSPAATGPSEQDVKDAGLTWAAWTEHGQKAFDLLNELDRAIASGSRKWRIEAQNKVDEFRKAHGDVLAFAEKERKAAEQSSKAADQRSEEAQKRASRVNQAARDGRIEDARLESQRLEEMRSHDLAMAGNNAEKRLEVERRYANLIRDARAAVARAEKADRDAKIKNNKDLTDQQRIDALKRSETQLNNELTAIRNQHQQRLSAASITAGEDAEKREREAQQRLSRLNDAARSRRIGEAQQELNALQTMRENDLRKAGEDAAARAQVERRYANLIRDGEIAIAKARKEARDAEIKNNKDYSDAERAAQYRLAQTEYDNAVDAAESKRADRLAQLDKEAADRQKEIAERRLELTRAVEDGRLDAARSTARRLLDVYNLELAAAGDNAEQRLQVQLKYKDDVLAAMNAIDRADADLRKKQLERERNAKVNTPGMSEAERQGWWAEYQRQIDQVDADLAVKLRANAQSVEQSTQDLTDAVSGKVKALSASYTDLTDRVRELTEAGRFDAEAQLDLAEALAELDRQAQEAGVSTNALVATARTSAAEAIKAGEAVRGWIDELARLDGATTADMAAGVRLGGGGQELIYDARAAVGMYQRGEYDLDALERTEEALRGAMETATPEVAALLEPLYEEVQSSISELIQRGIDVGFRSAARELQNQLAGLERANDQGQIDPLVYVQRRAELLTRLAEQEWEQRQQSAEFQRLTDAEKEEEYAAHQDRLTDIARDGEDERASILKAQQRSLQDDLLGLERDALERRNSLKQLSDEDYVRQSAELNRAEAALTLQRALQDHAGDPAAQAAARRTYWRTLGQIDTQEQAQLADMALQQARGLEDALSDVALSGLEQRQAQGMVSELEYLDAREQLQRQAAETALSRALADAKGDADLEAAARAQHEAALNRITAEGVQARMALVQQEFDFRLKQIDRGIQQSGGVQGYGAQREELQAQLSHWQQVADTTEEGSAQYREAMQKVWALEDQLVQSRTNQIGILAGYAQQAIPMMTSAMQALGGASEEVAGQWGKNLGEMVSDVANFAMAIAKGDYIGAAIQALTSIFTYFARQAQAFRAELKRTQDYNNQFRFDKDSGYGTRKVEQYSTGILFWKETHFKESVDEAGKAIALSFEGAVVNGMTEGIRQAVATGDMSVLDKAINRQIADAAFSGLMEGFLNSAVVAEKLGPLIQKVVEAFKTGNKELIRESLSDLRDGTRELRGEMEGVVEGMQVINEELGITQGGIGEGWKSSISAGLRAVVDGASPLQAMYDDIRSKIQDAIVNGFMVNRYMAKIQPYLDQLDQALAKGLNPQQAIQALAAQLPALSIQMQAELGPLITLMNSVLPNALNANTAATRENTAATREAQFQQTYITNYADTGRRPDFRTRLGGM